MTTRKKRPRGSVCGARSGTFAHPGPILGRDSRSPDPSCLAPRTQDGYHWAKFVCRVYSRRAIRLAFFHIVCADQEDHTRVTLASAHHQD
jgi:hypothetical protein